MMEGKGKSESSVSAAFSNLSTPTRLGLQCGEYCRAIIHVPEMVAGESSTKQCGLCVLLCMLCMVVGDWKVNFFTKLNV